MTTEKSLKIDNIDFGRISAQAAKQVIIQKFEKQKEQKSHLSMKTLLDKLSWANQKD